MGQTYSPPRFLLAFIGLLLISSAIYLLYAFGNQASLKKLSGKIANFSQAGVISSLDEIEDAQGAVSLDGTFVMLSDVEVRSRISEQMYIIGERKIYMPLALMEPDQRLHRKEKLKIIGVIYRMKDLAAVLEINELLPDQKEVLSRFEYFVLAQRVKG